MDHSGPADIDAYYRLHRFAYLPDGVSITTTFGEFVKVNEAFCKASGYAAEELLGKCWGALDLWADHVQRADYLDRLGKCRCVSHFPAGLVHRDGSVRQCLLTGTVVAVGGRLYVVTIGRDVTCS
ncbi:hypothetical protein NNJEOMEG_00756 [Fundidesulfovibrio magnetotacticus]|uniref:PAS domain-containing protein n=1 Tax=Fundidesulfovibrio magnetotacticus TaxID=2730080 RepID=A0A6V8LRG4_9BACT|nr:PAS domain S-box protein [Fundidesulfovibrio magnetotacticus]GFK92928.1 hypothetical protein NNJEOMEG_00756 [Fundidesulfovibrio magnetotacticus]